jgi:dipeptidyl-peptidase-3
MSCLTLDDQGTVTNQLFVKDVIDSLIQHEKLYALHLLLAAWHGSKIILRQTSHEAESFLTS